MLPFLFTACVALGGPGAASPAPPPPPTVDFGSLPKAAAARGPDHDSKPHPVLARLLADTQSIAQGSSARVGIHLTQQAGWHTYWKSPGEIGQATEVTWHAPANGTAGELQFPIPQRFEQDGMVSFGYDDQVLLMATLSLPADAPMGPHTLKADVDWLVCKTSCIPGKVSISLPIEVVASGQVQGPYAPLFDHYAAQLPAATTALTANYTLSASAVRPNDTFRAAFVLSSTDGTPFGAIPSVAWPTFTPIAASYDWGVDAVAVEAQPDGTIAVVVDGTAYVPDPLPTDARLGGLVQLKIGDKWVRAEVDGPLPFAPAGAAVTAVAHPAFDALPFVATPPPGHDTPAQVAPEGEAEPMAAAASLSASGEPLGAGPVTLLWNLLLAFFGGLILNVMPCVLPVLTLKLYGLVEQSDIGAGERRSMGMAYTAGVLVSFWALAGAVVAARAVFGIEVGWGFQFQYPPYVAGLATVVFVFGLSLLGVFELPVLGADAADDAAGREGLGGSFFTGVFATLLATPCSAPFLGTAIAYAFGAPFVVLIAIFTAVGLGLAAPFIAVAFVPALFRFLPRPGAWMDTLKQLLGFTLIATTVWLVDVLLAQIGSDSTVGYLAFLLVTAIGAWVYGRWGGVAATRQHQVLAGGAGIALSVLGGLLFLDLAMAETENCDDGSLAKELSFDAHVPWQAFSEPRVAALAGQTVFIDFTADWCLSCKVQERTVLETSAVRTAMDKLGVVPLKADWTRKDEVIGTWLRRHGREGVPMYLIIPGDPTKEPLLLPEVITQRMVVDALQLATQ